MYLVGVLNSGDVFIWNKDTDVIKYVHGMKDFAYKLGFHHPSVYISDDTSKILLVTSRNKVFIFETDSTPLFASTNEICGFLNASQNQKNLINGNWSAIVAPRDVKTVEDNKELHLHARFNNNQVCVFKID